MDDEQGLYRRHWPALRRCLYRLCLRPDRVDLLLDGLRAYCKRSVPRDQTPAKASAGPRASTPSKALRQAVTAWRDAILADLAPKTHAAGAWPGWQALMPLFGHTEKLLQALATQSDAICREAAAGETRTLWLVLHASFVATRDRVDGAGPTRLKVWRQIDRIRRDLNTQRRRQGLDDYQHLPEVAARVCDEIMRRRVKDAPTTVEGVLSYFYEFDPARALPYDEELHHLYVLADSTDSQWRQNLLRAVAALPAELRQAIEVRYKLRPQPGLRTAEAWQAQYGCSRETMRKRATRALARLRRELEM